MQFDKDAVRRIVRQVLHSERALRNPELIGPSVAQSVNQIWVPFKNDYSGEVPPYGVIALTDLTSANDAYPIWNARRPRTTLDRLYAVNSAKPVAAGGYGQCLLQGPCYVAYDFGNPAYGDGYGPRPNQFTLSKGYGHFCIVGEVINSGKKWLYGLVNQQMQYLAKTTAAVTGTSTTSYRVYGGTTPGSEGDLGFTTVPTAYVRGVGYIYDDAWCYLRCLNTGAWELTPLPGYETVIGKTDGAVSAGSTGTVSVWSAYGGSDTSDNISTVRNGTSVDIAATKYVRVEWINGSPYMEPWEC